MSKNFPRKDVIYGLHAVEEVLRARPAQIQAIILQKNLENSQALQFLEQQAQQRGITVLWQGRVEVDRLTSQGVHQGAVAICGEYMYSELSALLSSKDPSLLLVLDGITDPHNLGALIRSAYLLGAHGMIFTRSVGFD